MPRSSRRLTALAALLAGGTLMTLPAFANGARLSYEPVATAQLTPANAPAGGAAAGGAGLPGGAPAAGAGPDAQVGMPADGQPGAPTIGAGMDQGGENPTQDAPALGEGEGQSDANVYNSGDRRHAHIAPYIEAQEVADSELSPHSNTLTYTALAAGVDGSVNTRNAQGSVSLRYERVIGESGDAGSANDFSGVARGSVAVVPGVLRLDAAGFASRIDAQASGASLPNIATSNDALTQIYSVVGGPSLSTHAGDVALAGHYHIGYTHVGEPGYGALAPGQLPADITEHSTVQDAGLSASTKAGNGLPVGLTAEGGYYQENISVLAQRIRDEHVRGAVTIPVDPTVALVGGLGYEDVQVSSHNAVLDATGNPVYGANGQLQTDYAGPRYIAFDTSGLIWDVGVLWRPSQRTSFEAHVGRRYGDIGGYGLFTWHPTSRSGLNVAVYNNMAGFGGELNSSLMDLSNQFQTVRNAFTGSVAPCVNSLQGGTCLAGALGALRSTVFRARGVSANYNVQYGRLQFGIAGGYDRREYIGAAGTVLGIENGGIDQNYFVNGYVTYAIDRKSSVTGTLDAYWYRTGLVLDGDLNAVGATAVYQRRILQNLTASAALGVDSINAQALQDVWSASGELGMRYNF